MGGGAPVVIQSMTNIPLDDIAGTVKQIRDLNDAGAGLVRLAVRNEESIKYLREIRKEVDTPLSADVHFNYKIALKSIDAGIDKIRINPGNIKKSEQVREVVRAASGNGVPIRIGVNGGSVDLKRYGSVTPETLVRSALDHIAILEDNNFDNIVVSIKSSDLFHTLSANRLMSEACSYPLHIGLTEAGYGLSCVVHSSIAIGTLLLEGIGDTIRVSMTGDPVEEIAVAKKILESVGLLTPEFRIIACPTCGRTDPSIDLLAMAKEVEARASELFTGVLKRERPLVIAVMGCEVNGPGEAAHADVGIAGGRGGRLLIFARGEKIRTVMVDEAVPVLIEEIKKILNLGEFEND